MKHIHIFWSYCGLVFFDTLVITMAIMLPLMWDIDNNPDVRYHPFVLSLILLLSASTIKEMLSEHIFLKLRKLKTNMIHRLLNRYPITIKILLSAMCPIVGMICVLEFTSVFMVIYKSLGLCISTIIIILFTATVNAICQTVWLFLLYIFNHKKAYNSGTANLYHFPDYDTFGSAGPGRGYHSMNGKECIYVNLLKIETDNPNDSLLVEKNTEPVLYGKYSIFCIQDAVFWYAVLINEEFYCFDIRELANKMNLSSSLQNEVTTIIGNKRVWLQNFFQRLEDSAFFFDIENCFK